MSTEVPRNGGLLRPLWWTLRWRPSGWVRTVATEVQLALAVALLVTLWPSRLGGRADFIVVRGNSMEPTFSTGDLVIVRAAREYRVGDVVLYTVPVDEPGAGHRVMHRIVEILPDGTFSMQGDNSRNPDVWTPAHSDLHGRKLLIIPMIGAFVVGALVPLVFAILAGVSVAKDSGRHVNRKRVERPTEPGHDRLMESISR